MSEAIATYYNGYPQAIGYIASNTSNGGQWGSWYPSVQIGDFISGSDEYDSHPRVYLGDYDITPLHREKMERCAYCGLKYHEGEKHCEGCGAPL